MQAQPAEAFSAKNIHLKFPSVNAKKEDNQGASKPQRGKHRFFFGHASWYGPGFHGRLTASGERYNQYSMTAASKTLPFGTKLFIKNLRTGRCCNVTINDRGPYVAGRCLDLSKAAAQQIGMDGVDPVAYSMTGRVLVGRDALAAVDRD